MPEVCPQCGAYALRNIARDSACMTCTECGAQVPTNILPLFIVTGTSGAGKTSIIPFLRRLLPECLVFDKDLLGSTCYDHIATSWLLLAYGIAQGGRHTIICGTMMPQEVELCEVRDRIGPIHFLNLHCNDVVREQRLRARPAWRKSSSDEFIEEHRRFAHWLLEHAATDYNPPMPTVDTSDTTPEQSAQEIALWVREVLGNQMVVPIL